MKNIVFDLGGVLFARDKRKCDPEIIEFFSFLRAPKMPRFWEEYDRGTSTLGEVTDTLVGMTGRSRETCAAVLQRAIDLQEPVAPTEELVRDLKEAGYRLYVLSNMSREFIDYLRRFPVYGLFDGEVVSCEELCVKPEPRIYEILLDRYGLLRDALHRRPPGQHRHGPNVGYRGLPLRCPRPGLFLRGPQADAALTIRPHRRAQGRVGCRRIRPHRLLQPAPVVLLPIRLKTERPPDHSGGLSVLQCGLRYLKFSSRMSSNSGARAYIRTYSNLPSATSLNSNAWVTLPVLEPMCCV